GNGNVMGLVDGSSGTLAARYEYDPFGQTIRSSGANVPRNPIRFTSKYVDDETDFAYYGYRYLNACANRWLSRDPIGENASPSLYACNLNDSIARFDKDGRLTVWNNGLTRMMCGGWIVAWRVAFDGGANCSGYLVWEITRVIDKKVC